MKSQLYTRTGDEGKTSLVGGERVDKNSARIEAYGTVDELSSQLGTIVSDPKCNEEVKGQVKEIQNELFNIGSYLATKSRELTGEKAEEGEYSESLKNSDENDSFLNLSSKLLSLETWIDTLDEQTPKIRAFVLPGGCELAAKAHVARTVCRRAERRILDLAATEHVNSEIVRYINRLSDYLFIVARYFNFMQGEEEIVWSK